ncbi:MAG TPA: Gfo/Idh/MocA family oxidoreductase, partial [Gemmataceae bacterium]
LGAAGAGVAGLVMASGAHAGAAQTVRCGFVGVGSRGSALLRAALRVEGVEVVAVCDIDATNLGRALEAVEKARGNKPAGVEDWNKLLARDDLTAVVSALPCDLHYPMYRDTLAAGKHLYGEKPMCLTAAHADALVKQSEECGKVFQVGFQRRFGERLRKSVELFREGVIGEPFEGRGVRFGSGGPYRRPGEWFSFRERSGDWMLEQAVHNFDAFTWALGELPQSAFGTGRQDLFKDWDPKRDVSDYYTAILRYKNGLTLTWTHTWAAPPHPEFAHSHEQLVGPKGGIDLGKGLVAFRKGAAPASGPTRQVDGGERRQDTTLLALQGFFDCVRTGKPPVVGAKEGRDATLFGLLVRQAVYEQRVVTMDEVRKG